MQKEENGDKYHRTVAELVERLAISQAYLQAIDDTIDIFADLERGKAMLICSLVNRAQADALPRAPGYRPLRVNPTDIINAARNGDPIKIKETQAYKELHAVINNMAREIYRGEKA